jgi:phytoene dehydrogenase-like protein
MQTIVIGSGLSGLAAALYRLRAGDPVSLFEQGSVPGGVTAALQQDGYTWDLGQLLVEGFGPGEQAGLVLEELGVGDRIERVRDDRLYAFPDFQLLKPEAYGGPFWRRERLKQLFPDDARGLDRYYRFYVRMVEVMSLARRAERAEGIRSVALNALMFAKLLPVLHRRGWSAERMMQHFFRSERLRAVFTSILADFVVRPSEFPGLGIPSVNPEPAFDKRVPLEISRWGHQPSYQYIRGGVGALTTRMVEAIEKAGGQIHTSRPIEGIQVEDGAVRSVLARDGEAFAAERVLVSGGARESLIGLVGREHFDEAFLSKVDGLPLMESIFMVHLGVDLDPTPHQPSATCYYYGTYDIEHGVDLVQSGGYHGGRDGFVVYVPSLHSPQMAPPGHHALTIYTIAPNQLSEGTWAERREEFADELVSEAEKFIPGLQQHTRVRVTLTPEDFRRRTFLRHHSFGGVAPMLGRPGVPHATPVRGLWFIGAQSESGAGMNNVLHGVWRTHRAIERA